MSYPSAETPSGRPSAHEVLNALRGITSGWEAIRHKIPVMPLRQVPSLRMTIEYEKGDSERAVVEDALTVLSEHIMHASIATSKMFKMSPEMEQAGKPLVAYSDPATPRIDDNERATAISADMGVISRWLKSLKPEDFQRAAQNKRTVQEMLKERPPRNLPPHDSSNIARWTKDENFERITREEFFPRFEKQAGELEEILAWKNIPFKQKLEVSTSPPPDVKLGNTEKKKKKKPEKTWYGGKTHAHMAAQAMEERENRLHDDERARD